MKKILLASSLVIGLSFASLINTGDQGLRSIEALGSNPAAKAYNKAVVLEAGATVLNKFGQTGSVLQGGTDIDPVPNLMNDLFIQYTAKATDKVWVSGVYQDNNSFSLSYKTADLGGGAKTKGWSYQNTNKLAVDASTELMKGLYLGAELANNKIANKIITEPNKAAGGSSAKTDYTNETGSYLSLKVGGIYEYTKDITLVATQKFNPEVSWSDSGKIGGASITKTESTEALPNVTSIGGIYKVSDVLSVGGTLDKVWAKEYTMTTKTGGDETDVEVAKLGYDVYTLAAEYKLLKDMTLQGSYSWANRAGRYTTDVQNIAGLGTDITETNVSVTKALDDAKLTGGIILTKLGSLDDAGKIQNGTTDAKYYASYSYLF